MRLGATDLEVVVADITTLKVDAIANAANAALELHSSALRDPPPATKEACDQSTHTPLSLIEKQGGQA